MAADCAHMQCESAFGLLDSYCTNLRLQCAFEHCKTARTQSTHLSNSAERFHGGAAIHTTETLPLIFKTFLKKTDERAMGPPPLNHPAILVVGQFRDRRNVID